MKRLLFYIGFFISTNVNADVIRITCSSDKVFSVYRVGDTFESHTEINKLISFVSINLSKSEIKISWRNDTYDTSGDIRMKIIDIKNGGQILLGLRSKLNSYELHHFDLENLRTSWTMISPTGDMHMLSKCFK